MVIMMMIGTIPSELGMLSKVEILVCLQTALKVPIVPTVACHVVFAGRPEREYEDE